MTERQHSKKQIGFRGLSALGLLCFLTLALISVKSEARPVCISAFAPNQKVLPEISKISFIVPVYRELQNGNIQSFLRRLDESTREMTTEKRLRVTAVFAVNNTREIAADPTSSVWLENQRTIEYLNQEMKRHPYEIKVIDLSTEGTERNMGVIRETAVTQLLSQQPGDTKVNHENHALVHMDVDTKLPPKFFTHLVDAYGTKQDVVFFARSYELRDELRTPLIKSHPDYKRKRAWRDLQILLGGLRQGVATYQISSRASAHLEVGGFKPLAQGEDTQLSKDLLTHTHLLDSKIVVATEDRSRPDGFTSARRWDGLNGVAPRKNLFPHLLFLDPWIDRAEELIQQGVVSTTMADRAFESLVKTEFGAELDPQAGAGAHLRERYKSYLYKTSVTPAQDAYDSFTVSLPPHERALFNKIRDSRMAELAKTEKLRQTVIGRYLADQKTKLSSRERRFAKDDPFVKWLAAEGFVEGSGEGFVELGTYQEKGRLHLEKLRANEPALADWISPTDLRSVFREHASLVALYDGIARLSEAPELAPVAAAKLAKLREGPRR
jgi:hypothetical protein